MEIATRYNGHIKMAVHNACVRIGDICPIPTVSESTIVANCGRDNQHSVIVRGKRERDENARKTLLALGRVLHLGSTFSILLPSLSSSSHT